MADSVVGICNEALTLLGQEPITSLNDQTKAVTYCAIHFPGARDEALSDGQWNCATFRQALVAQSTAPVFGFAFAFPLPTDPYCLRALATSLDMEEGGDSATEWKIEAPRLLVTDASAVNLKYIGRVFDVTQFDPRLSAAVAFRLAYKLAMPLSGSRQLAGDLSALYEAEIKAAKAVDGKVGTPRRILTTTLTRVRNAP